LGQQVANYVAANFAPEQPFDLVGFSMGGIVSRYYVQDWEELTAFSASLRWLPHSTWMAYLSERPGCLQMRPDSPFIQKLNQDAVMLELNFTSGHL